MVDPHFVYVEDDTLSREVVRVLIQEVLGYPALTLLDSSANLLEQLGSLPYAPEIFFLDMQVAPHDGFEMLRMLRAAPPFRDKIIVALTANVMAHDVEALRQAGFDGLIGKPVRKKIFPELVERLLRGEPVWYIP